MKNKRPYDLSYLLAYLENELSAEEDIVLAEAIREEEQLRLIVAGIESYQMEENDLSLEEYLQQSKKELWKKITAYTAQKEQHLSPGEKSFKQWIVEKKLHWATLFLVGLYGLVIIGILQFGKEESSFSVKEFTYLFQVLVLAIAGISFLRFSPKLQNSSKHYRAILGRQQMWMILKKLSFSWFSLYLALFIFSIYQHLEVDLWLNAANNITIVYLYLFYYCLNKDSIDWKAEQQSAYSTTAIKTAIQKPIQTRERWAMVFVGLAFLVELILVENFEKAQGDFHLLFGLISGLICMAFTTQLVRRIGSKFLSKENTIILCLSFYAGIQPLLIFIFPDNGYLFFSGEYKEEFGNIISMTLVNYALFGKILLLAFISWSLETNRIIKYFNQTKELEDQDEEKELLDIKKDFFLENQD